MPGDLFAPASWPVVTASGPGFSVTIRETASPAELRAIAALAAEVMGKRFPGEGMTA